MGKFWDFGGIVPFNFTILEVQIALKIKENDMWGQRKVLKISEAPNGAKKCLKRLSLDPFRHEAFQGLFFSRVFSILFTIE